MLAGQGVAVSSGKSGCKVAQQAEQTEGEGCMAGHRYVERHGHVKPGRGYLHISYLQLVRLIFSATGFFFARAF